MTVFKSPYGGISVRGISVTELLFEGLSGDPERIVITEGPTGRQTSAGELEQDIRRLAGGLSKAGYGRGCTTALMAPNIPEYTTVFHGVAFAGGTVTTVNPTYTATEVRHQLADSSATLLVTVPMFLETAQEAAQGTQVTRIVVIGEAEGAEPLSALMGNPQKEQTPVDTARDIVVLPYSSGTTGLAKGVMLTHDNLVVNVDQTMTAADVLRGETTVAFLPFFHIYGMTVLMNLYLSKGGHLITLPRFDLELFLQLVQDHRVRQLWIVPPIAVALAKHPLVDQFDLSSVERGFSGAAPLGGDTTAAVEARLGFKMVQGYGMTEMSPVSHASTFDDYREGASGRAIPGTLSRIVSEDGTDLGPGEDGELWVKGPQVMTGYLNNPEATSETIVEDGWLRTGDLAAIDDDGFLFLKERVKELIKVKGFQVAPAELEATLMADPSIDDAAVIALPDEEAGERPMAFVVAAPGSDLSKEAVRQIIASQLSSYKHLARVDMVESIPKSASGKILRRVLRDQIS